MDDLDRLKQSFYSEAEEILETLDVLLLDLEKDPEDKDILNSVFRSMHTLKGSSGIFEFNVLERTAHIQEDLLDYIREENISPSTEIMDILFEGLDLTKTVFEMTKDGEEIDEEISMDLEVKIKAILPEREVVEVEKKKVLDSGLSDEFLNKISDATKEKVVEISNGTNRLYQITMKLEGQCLGQGIDPFLLMKSLSYDGDIIDVKADVENIPPINLIDPAELYFEEINMLFSSLLGAEEVDNLFEFAHEAGIIEIHQFNPSELKTHFGIDADGFWLDSQNEKVGEPISEESSASQSPAEGAENSSEAPPQKLGEILVEMGEVSEEQLSAVLEKQQTPLGTIMVQEGIVSSEKVEKALVKQRKTGSKPQAAIKVDTEKLDSLVNLVGELVIAQTIISHNKSLLQGQDTGLSKTISHLNKITRDLQEEIMSIRMLPIRATFQKLMRVARDVSKKQGKDVETRVFGEDTELDKTVIDEIGDPLLHMLRNAVDHGIESPDEREKAGKPRKGIVELKAYHQGGNIVIEIKEDGAGLKKDVILQKALEKGIVNAGDELTDQQIYHLIFEPGFSTAKSITSVSGRGVGMDVVKRSIEKLRGKVDISTEVGRGTTFTINLPLTLAVIDGMVVRVGEERYIIPTISIVESIKPQKEQFFTVKGKGEMIKVRDELFPMTRLHELFSLSSKSSFPWESLVILVEGEGKRGCLLVDELLGQQQVVIKSLGEGFRKLRGISGGSILGDGRVGLILDTAGILDMVAA